MKKYVYALVCIAFGVLSSAIANAQLNANFTSNIVTGCSPIWVQFNDISTGGPTSWSWDLGNGTISTLQNPSTTYITPGTYTVTLTVSNGSGSNVKTVTNYITVVPTPVVSFAASDSGISCPPKTVQFSNNSVPGVGGAATYLWDFGDGNTSTLQNPTHTYATFGTFSLTLSVTNSAGCSKILTKANYIQTIQKPIANFTGSNNNSCTLPLNVSFSNLSTGAISYLWNFGDGGTSTAANPSHNYTSAGSYTVTLIATNNGGCKDTLVIPSFVNIGSLTASFAKSVTNTCTNNNVTFTNTSTPGAGNSTWYFGDGTSLNSANAVHSYSAPGTYTVKLVVNYNNCSDSTTQTVVVNQGPNPQFTASPTMGCAVPFTTQFTNTTTGATGYFWIFGDGTTSTATNPSHAYTAMGVYTVQLVAYGANGCSDTLTMPNYINLIQPVMSIGSNLPSQSGCAPAVVTFTTYITYPFPVTSYTWNFGDGTIVSGASSMTHTYSTPGSYTISVNYSTGPGCNYTSIGYSLNVGLKPTASFTANPVNACPQQQINFTNTSSASGGTNYTWYFGDGNTSTQTNPTHAYNAQGTYNVLLVANNNGCFDTFQSTITVYPPQAAFSPVYNCTNRLQVSFNNTSTGANLWAWDFGDGTTSTLQNPPAHNYAAYGTYNVTLTVTNLPSGCTSVHTVPVVLFPLQVPFVASDSNVCRGLPVTFTAQVPSGVGQYLSNASWYFGDGNSILNTGITTTHAYTANGTYTVSLVITDIRGCKDTFTKSNYINVFGPTANFNGTPTSGCAPLTVNFTDISNNGGSVITARAWQFGDGSTNNGNFANVANTYAAGTYSVTLTVTDANGCVDAIAKPNYITATKPIASFYAPDTNRCPGQAVTFINGSAGSNLTYSWSFGDGGTSTAANPTHAYAAPGDYTVTLIVTDGTNCKDTLLRTNYIHVIGINMSFSASDTFATCPPLSVSFTNTSVGLSNITWSFGNGNTSSLPNPSTIYTVPGVYTVKMYGQNAAGCYDSVSKTITVLGPTGTLTYTPLTGCLPLTVQFNSTNTNTAVLIWDMNNGVTQTTTASNTTYTYNAPGSYVPKLLLSDGVSCIVPILGTDTIKVDKVDADFSFTPNNICNSGTIQFTDTTIFSLNPITSRSWNFGDGGTSTVHNPTHYYNAPGTYSVTLIIGTAQGCADTITKTVTILPPPVVSAGSNVAICAGTTTPVQLQATGAVTYIWSPASTLSCSNCANPQATPTSTTTYAVIGIAANGCMDTAQVTVTVNPLPVITTGPVPTICEGSTVQLSASGASSYSWSPAAGLSCTTCPNPTATIATTTTYVVTGTSTAGCTDTAQVTVNVNANPNVAASASTNVICAGASSQLQASGAVIYSWTPATGLSCTNCANPVATPAVTTTYIVTGTNASGCTDTAMVTIVVNQLPAVSGGSNKSICLGSSTQLQGNGATSYLWSPATGLTCTNCPNPFANPTSTTIYTVTGTDANGCVNTSQVTVTVNPLPTVSAGNDQTACLGTPVSLLAFGATSYFWTPSTGLSCTNCANPNAIPTVTTTYTVVGTDANGCSGSAQVTVNINPLPVVDAGPDQSICKLNAVQLQATGALSYSWTPASGLSCSNCPNPSASPAATTTYTVTGTDANGCRNSDNVTISLFPQPIVDAGADKSVCRGVSVQLNATGAMSFVWSPVTGLSCTACPNPVATPANNITYTVVGTDANGCRDSDRVTINVTQMQPFVYGPGDTLCQGESTQVFASGGDSYLWYPSTGLSSTTSNNPTVTPAATTTYTVVVKQGSCFSDTNKITVIVHPKPIVNAGPDQTILAGGFANLFADAKYTDQYTWSPADDLSCNDCASPVATPKKTTTYTVFASNRYGCKAQDDVTIFVNCDNSLIYLANTFTPNGDGNNDRFYPQGKGVESVKRFRIFNRWGEMLYDAQDIPLNSEIHGWDGTFKGDQLNPDVFVYILEATCTSGEPMVIKGDVSLIR